MKNNRSASTDSTADPFSVTSLIGQGRYQKALIILLCVFISPFMAFNNIAQYMILLEPEFECARNNLPPMETLRDRQVIYTVKNLTHDFPEYDGYFNQVNFARKDKALNAASLFLELKRECYIQNDSMVPCPYGYKYKTDFIYDTIVSDYDWVCENASPKFLALSLYWLGSIFGVLVVGQLSDKCVNFINDPSI